MLEVSILNGKKRFKLIACCVFMYTVLQCKVYIHVYKKYYQKYFIWGLFLCYCAILYGNFFFFLYKLGMPNTLIMIFHVNE